jgi:hypothetical protein
MVCWRFTSGIGFAFRAETEGNGCDGWGDETRGTTVSGAGHRATNLGNWTAVVVAGCVFEDTG